MSSGGQTVGFLVKVLLPQPNDRPVELWLNQGGSGSRRVELVGMRTERKSDGRTVLILEVK